jgi:hypothetical protein
VTQDALDHIRIQNERDDPHRFAAPWATQRNPMNAPHLAACKEATGDAVAEFTLFLENPTGLKNGNPVARGKPSMKPWESRVFPCIFFDFMRWSAPVSFSFFSFIALGVIMKRIVTSIMLASLLITALPALAGNTCETATPLTWIGNFGGPLAPGEVVWFEGTGPIGELFILRLPGYASGFSIEVLTGDCSSPSLVAGPFTAGGDYAMPQQTTDGYFIRVTGEPGAIFYGFDLLESNDSCGDGVMMGLGDFYDGGFHHEDDYDWFGLTLSAGDCVQVNVQSRDGEEYAACNVLIHDDPNSCNSGMHGLTGGPEGIVFLTSVDAGGTYWLRLDYNSYYPATFPSSYRIYVDTCEAVDSEELGWDSLKAFFK